MDFALSSDQRLLKESVERFVRRDYPFTKRRANAAADGGFGRDTWAVMAELGWLGAALPEDWGGSGGGGGGGVETMVLMEGLGRGLVVEPLLSSAVLGGGLIRYGGSDAQKAALLPALVRGELLLAFAYAERQSRYDLQDVALTARRDGVGFVLDGHKGVVLGGDTADAIVVSARTGGARRDAAGISLFLVGRDVAGLTSRGYPTIDGSRAAEFVFDGVAVVADALVGDLDGSLPLIERVVDTATAAVSAEALGIMSVLNEATLEYLKTREQFGQPIGQFQALQHRMVDMSMAREETQLLVAVAALTADADDPARRAHAVSAAKVQVGKAGRLIGQEAVQLHGAIAMTDEYGVGHYFKRLGMIGRLFGDADHHLRRFASL